MASTWQVEIDYGLGWVDLTSYGGENLIQRGSIQPKFVMHNDKFEPVQDSVKFTSYLNTTLANTLLNVAYDQTILCRIHRDSADYFYGYLRPVTEYTVAISERWIEFEALDNSRLLLNKPSSRSVWESYKVCDTTTPAASIVHQLLNDAGYTLGTDEDITQDINVTVSVYSIEEDKKDYRKLLTELLYDYGYVYYFNASGQFKIYQWRADSIPSPTTTFDSSNTPAGDEVRVKVEDIEEKTFVVWYYDIVTRNKQLWASGNIGDQGSACDITVDPYWPDTTKRHNFNFGKDNEFLKVEDIYVYHKFEYTNLGGIFGEKATGTYVAGTGYSGADLWLTVSDFSSTNSYADFRFYNTVTSLVCIKGFYYVAGLASVRTKAGEATAGSGGVVEEYKARNITTAAEAEKLAQALLKNNINGRYKYRVSSETDADLGEYCTVANTALNISTTARVTQKELDTESEIYRYELIGVDELGVITATSQGFAEQILSTPEDLSGGIAGIDDAVNSDGTIAQPVQGNKLADADTSSSWRTIVGPQIVGTQISDIGATTWTNRAYWGGEADDDWPSFGKADGLASASADLSDLDIGDLIPTGAKVFQFNSDVLDLDDADPWDTETGVNYTTASRFGSHALQPVTGGSTTLVDSDAQGIDFTGDFSFSGWWYYLDNPSSSESIVAIENSSPAGVGEQHCFIRLQATATGVSLITQSGTLSDPNETVSITLSMSGWFFAGVAYDQSTNTWTLVVNATSDTLTPTNPPTTDAKDLTLYLSDGARADDFMIADGTALSAVEFDAHYDSGYPWATEDADGNLYLVPATGKKVIVKGAFEVGEGEHDTGWVACSDWTNQHLGDAVGGNVNHSLGTSIRDLSISVFVSTDGTDDNSFEVTNSNAWDSGGFYYGLSIYQIDSNNIQVQTGTGGIVYISSSGLASSIATSSWYYRVIVRVEAPAKGDTGDTGPAGPTGDTGPAGAQGEDGATSLAVAYSASTDYVVGEAVYYDSIIWQCVQVNGPSTTVVTPGTNTAYWQNYPRFYTSSSDPTSSDGANGDLWFTYTV